MNVFERIYRTNGWNGRVSLSGPGSDEIPTRPAADVLERLLVELRIRSVANAGCGDDLWTSSVLGLSRPDLAYVGLDVAPSAIARARRRHPGREYRHVDIREPRSIPRVDLVLLRDVVQHLSPADALRVLRAVRVSGSTWLLASTYSGPSTRHPGQTNEYADGIETGGYWCPDLTSPPFDLPEPERVWPDGYSYEVPGEIRDPSKWLGLWRLTSS